LRLHNFVGKPPPGKSVELGDFIGRRPGRAVKGGFGVAIFNECAKPVLCWYMQRFLAFPDGNRWTARNSNETDENQAKVALDNRSFFGIKCLPAQWLVSCAHSA
jgi:hypothetical protein